MQMNSPDESVSAQAHKSTSESGWKHKAITNVLNLFSIYYSITSVSMCAECGTKKYTQKKKHWPSKEYLGELTDLLLKFALMNQSSVCRLVLDYGAIHTHFILDITFVIFRFLCTVNGYRKWIDYDVVYLLSVKMARSLRQPNNEQKKKKKQRTSNESLLD